VTTVSFHFHGYQPGDLVRWREPDPLKPQAFEDRMSPVSHRVGSDRISGRNWTDAVLRTYGRLQAVLDRTSEVASVDIEPQTLVWLLERDPDAYRRIIASYERGAAALALTPPFHPILPHHHAFEREVLLEMMFDFYAPLLRRVPRGSIGLWLPEAAYSRETVDSYFEAARRAAVSHENLPDLVRGVHLLLDARQFAGSKTPSDAWAKLDVDHGMPVAGRDIGLSADFAFGASDASEFHDAAVARMADTLLVASDLESLLANPAQAERFEAIVAGLRGHSVIVSPPAPPSKLPSIQAVDFSSWSDYDEYIHEGHTSDTRWTGLRRADAAVVARTHLGKPLSQLWKHAFTLASEQVETLVRRTTRNVLRGLGVVRPGETLRRLSVAYGRHLFREHYRACGLASADVDFDRAAETIVGGKVDLETAGYFARGYVLMLMGLRSDPRFWDNPDTRVTFQNVALLAQSLMDVAEACSRAGDSARTARVLQFLRATLLEFSEAYVRGEFAGLHGSTGWETTEAAWYQSLQSEVPDRSGYDVVRRATLYAIGEQVSTKLPDIRSRREDVVADTGHIVGEAHGDWENKGWCEHRTA
jgi:hypothetical protein